MYRQRWFNPRTGEMINGRENLASSGALSRATDADGVPPAMSIRNLPTGASFDDNGNGTRNFRWRRGASDTGRQVFSLLATDHAISSFTDTMDLVVIIQP